MLNLININVTIGRSSPLERRILDNLTLNLKPGEFALLIGGNGAGKSTLFNAISGITPIDSGSIILDKIDITNWPVGKRSSLIAKVLQDPRIATISSMTIEENLSFALKRGQRRGFAFHANKTRRAFFKEKLSHLEMGLENRLNEPAGNLSGGQRQALSLIMALMKDSKVLLLDEITAALDPHMAELIMELTARIIREEKRTTLLITHNMSHINQYGDRALRLENGQITSLP